LHHRLLNLGMDHFSFKELVLLLTVFLFVAIFTYSSRSMRLYTIESIKVTEPVNLYLYERTNLTQLSELMDSLSIDYNREELQWAGQTLRWRVFNPGRYHINRNFTYSDFLSKLARGLQDPVRVTILPGVDKDRLSRNLSLQLRADSSSFRAIFNDSSSVALELNLTGEELFSRMLPNTYELFWTTEPTQVIRRVHREFMTSVNERFSEEIEANALNLNEIVILASIVEWESRVNEEKPRVSGLYLNRLQRGMMLQADPTVVYALGERRRLLFVDYEIDHPYNTYRIRGLPPGPITNPALSSIRSVLYPEEHDYLFMVATPEGTHRFSRTYQEHQAASEEWRRWLREQVRIGQQRRLEESN